MRAPEAFDHSDFLFELKQDSFRALALIKADRCELVSRRAGGSIYVANAVRKGVAKAAAMLFGTVRIAAKLDGIQSSNPAGEFR